MLPQYMALSVSQLVSSASLSKKKIVCPFVGFHCGCVPPSLKICVSVCWATLWVSPSLVCVLALEDNLRWILACCLLRFAAFLVCVLHNSEIFDLNPCILLTELSQSLISFHKSLYK